MLVKIREKLHGVFAWVILLMIVIPFALWGIQNYLDVGKERPIVSVGDKDFFQREVTQAMTQYSQNYAGMNLGEDVIKAQALKKLINDEVLFQYVEDENLVISDENARNFIKSLPYFQTDGKFDDKQYKALLNSQGMSSAQFALRVKKSMTMEQFQRAIMDSSFATPSAVENFFKIQNQQRDVEYVTVALPKITTPPTAEELQNYYQQHQDLFQTPEQVAVEYIELSVDELAKAVTATDEQLQAYYQDQKDQYSTKERRKISHILFAVGKDVTEAQALQKAQQAQEALKTKDFAAVAKEMSDDKLSAEKGGDLGLFNAGVMEKDFDAAAGTLALNAVSQPVKTSFGYHLIKVTEFVPGETKPYADVKAEVTKAYQKAQAENKFYELGEKIAQLSYENSGSLGPVSEALKLTIQKTALESKDSVNGIFVEPKVKSAAFSEEVLNGNNSEAIEAGANRLVVLRMLEHKPATVLPLKDVEAKVSAAVLADKAKQQNQQMADNIKKKLEGGSTIAAVAAEHNLAVQKFPGLVRNNNKLPWQLIQEIFKAPKPVGTKPSLISVELDKGERAVVSIAQVKPGVMSEEDKKQLALATKNIAKAFGQSIFAATISNLEADADVVIHK